MILLFDQKLIDFYVFLYLIVKYILRYLCLAINSKKYKF